MRSMIGTNAAASWRDRVTNSSVWQWAQPRMSAFCASVPGKLASHSALVSCAARSCVGASVRSAAAGVPAPIVTVDGVARS
jgi:hypothetical protein